MQNHNFFMSKGFTLVELAVVLTIVALLIGGVLKGQEMIEDARVVATVAQVHTYESAALTFKKVYGDLPGDLPNASSRIRNCDDCDPADSDYAGDGWVGDPNPGFSTGTMGNKSNMGTVWQGYSDSSGVDVETRLFWAQLFATQMINDVITSDIKADAEFGKTMPAARIGGGFLVGSVADNSGFGGGRMDGILLALVDTTLPGSDFPLTPLRAAQIDRKMDDGFPTSGNVQDAAAFRASSDAGGGVKLEPSLELEHMKMNKGAGPGTSACRGLTSAMEAAGYENEGYLEGEESSKVCSLAIRIRH